MRLSRARGRKQTPPLFQPPFFLFSLHPSLSLVTLSLPPNQPTNSGRVDATKELDDFSLTASVTDATAKDIDNAPHLRDALITARTKKDGTNLMIGYDAGQRGALAGLTTATELAGKAVDLGATWFQNGNHVRGEARVQIDSTQSLWATKTLNDDNDVGNATVVNLAERKAFVIEPFNIPVSTAAVKYSIEREGYTVEPAYDLNTKGTFLWMKFFSPPLFCFGLGGKRDRTAMQSSLQRNLKARLRVQAEKAAKVQEAKMQEARGVRLWRETEGTRGERGKAG